MQEIILKKSAALPKWEIIFSKYNYDSQEILEQFVFDAKTGKQILDN